MKRRCLIQILLVLVLSACGWVTNATATAVSSLPAINVGLVDANSRCLNDYYIQARILNQGNAPAEGVVALEVST
jgi:hypothetical protein